MWIEQAVTPELNGNGDSIVSIGEDTSGHSELSSFSSITFHVSDCGDDVLPPLPPPGGTDYIESPL
jgi:hypothetical protein